MTTETGAVHFRSSEGICGPGADSFPVVSHFAVEARRVRWEGGKRGRKTSSLFPSHQPQLPLPCYQNDWRGSSHLLRPAEITEQDNAKNDSKQM